jgi:hypothetical protein
MILLAPRSLAASTARDDERQSFPMKRARRASAMAVQFGIQASTRIFSEAARKAPAIIQLVGPASTPCRRMPDWRGIPCRLKPTRGQGPRRGPVL